MATRFDSEVYAPTLTCATINLPASCVTNSQVLAGAGIDASKLDHRHQKTFAQTGTASSVTQVVHVVKGAAGTVTHFRAGSVTAAVGNSTVTVDLKKNGTSVLSAPITLDSGNVTYTPENGTVTTTGVVAGDVLAVVTVATVGTGTLPTGLYADVVLDEEYN